MVTPPPCHTACDTGQVRDADPTADEIAFFDALEELVPGVRDRYYEDPDGSLWMIASFDIPDVGVLHATLRCDYDGQRLRGGRSPSLLNRDHGLRAVEAGIDITDEDGLDHDITSPIAAAHTAAAWFRDRIAAHRQRGGS